MRNKQIPMKMKDSPKLEKINNLSTKFLELTSFIDLLPMYINKNHDEERMDFAFYKNQKRLLFTLHKFSESNKIYKHP